MSYKIVCDSSANMLGFDGVDFSAVPLHITVNDVDFIDDKDIDLVQMQAALKAPKCRSVTACPSPEDWISAFGDAENVFVITITGGLSGSNASANVAKGIYEDEHPGRHVYVCDSLSVGPEMVLLAERVRELIDSGMAAERIARELDVYHRSTHLYFSLGSLNNLANNGRVNALLAKGIGLLGMRILGRASDIGKLQPMDKCRGDRKALVWLRDQLKEEGYKGGKIIISHTNNEAAALELSRLIEQEYGTFNGYIMENRGLTGYYAEPMSVLLGFEA